MQSSEDKDYVIRLKNGDFAAFDKLFKKYSESIYAFTLSISKEIFVAEEVTQLVFLKIWEKRFSLDEYLSFKSLLFSITYNETISWIRKEKSEIRRINSFANKTGYQSNDTDFTIEFNNINDLAIQIIDSLPEKRKEIFKLSREQGLSNAEIAETLGISVKTVENQMTSALRLLREKLGQIDIFGILFFT